MKKFNCMFLLAAVWAGVLSCSDKDEITGRTSYLRYLFYSYYIPNAVFLEVDDDKTYCRVIWEGDVPSRKISEKDNLTEFKRLAGEYGETGEKPFKLSFPGFVKTFGISTVKVYRQVGDERLDVSDQAVVDYDDWSDFISSKYEDHDFSKHHVLKKVSELTEHDIKWLSWVLHLWLEMEDKTHLFLVVTLKDNTELSAKITE